MKTRNRLLVCLALLVASPCLAESSIIAFDLDDNVLSFSADESAGAILTRKVKIGDEKPRRISSAEFAEVKIRPGLPKHDIWNDWELGPEAFIETSSNGGHNYFKESIEKALAKWDGKGKPGFLGPAWTSFAKLLDNEETAKTVSIITARGHDPAHIKEGLQLLKDRGLISQLPKEDQIHTVFSPAFESKHAHLSLGGSDARKAIVIEKQLDELNKEKDANWVFSDDDFGNVLTAQKLLSEKKSRWPNVSMTIHYTGPHRCDLDAHFQSGIVKRCQGLVCIPIEQACGNPICRSRPPSPTTPGSPTFDVLQELTMPVLGAATYLDSTVFPAAIPVSPH